MTTSSFYTDGDPNTGVEVAGPSSSAFYVDSEAAANSATQAAASAAAAAASQSAAATSASDAATSATNAAAAVQSAAGTATPLVDGTAAVGVSTKWAHEDHRHPTDTSRAPTASPTFTGSITAGSKGHIFGTGSGTAATGSVTPADANIQLYNAGATNWAGIGTDGSGHMWFKTGISGTPAPAMYISNAQVVNFANSPLAPTPSLGDNSTKVATTAFVMANGGSTPATAPPLADGTAAVGVSTKYAREDHVHPADTSRLTSVKDFGAVGNGTTDDTVAIQAAINAVQGTGRSLLFPVGSYKVSSTLSVTGTLRLVGESRNGSVITWASTTLHVLSVACDTGISVDRLTFSGPAGPTAGNIITLTGSATQNIFSTFRECTFVYGFNQIVTVAACDWVIENCVFTEYVNYGVYVSDTFNVDAGDSFIGNGCTFFTSSATGVGIYQVSSGGLKVVGNKLLGGLYGYQMSLSTLGTATVDLLLIGNSIENQTAGAVYLTRPSGSVVFGNVVIVGNQIAGQGAATATSWIGIGTDGNSGWLSRIVISGNQLLLPPGTGTPVFVGISIGSSSDFLIEGNVIDCSPNASGSNYGISIGTGATDGLIGLNKFGAFLSGVWAAKISNGAPSEVMVTQNVVQSGTTTTALASTTSYGSLFTGAQAITFPKAYALPPTVVCDTGTFPSGVSALPLAVTSTGFTLQIITTVSQASGTYVAGWKAIGVL